MKVNVCEETLLNGNLSWEELKMVTDMVFRRATQKDMPRIMEMQLSIFHGEQGIPEEEIAAFEEKEPACWCAEQDGKICGAAAAWKDNGDLHWGRFVVLKEMRGNHIGTQLARYSFDDIFNAGTEVIYMDARDITVNIVCNMGGEITGEPYPFFKGNVTPIIMRKSAYRENTEKYDLS